jgi:NitT/TauT family transport system ATP-binding protein
MEKMKIKNLSKTFITEKETQVKAIEDMTFDVEDGEFLCLVGPSGCGKTTILRIIADLESPTAGSITWMTKDHSIGFVFQGESLLPWRSVWDNIAFGLELEGRPEKEIKEEVSRLISMMGLEGFESSYPRELSGGMQKRVAIARAFSIDPDILLMDEPFVSLDAQTRNILQEEVLKIWSETKNTVIFITHNVDEAVYLADRVLILTPRPTKVKYEVPIRLPRPRDRTEQSFIEVRKDILAKMKTGGD